MSQWLKIDRLWLKKKAIHFFIILIMNISENTKRSFPNGKSDRNVMREKWKKKPSPREWALWSSFTPGPDLNCFLVRTHHRLGPAQMKLELDDSIWIALQRIGAATFTIGPLTSWRPNWFCPSIRLDPVPAEEKSGNIYYCERKCHTNKIREGGNVLNCGYIM